MKNSITGPGYIYFLYTVRIKPRTVVVQTLEKREHVSSIVYEQPTVT